MLALDIIIKYPLMSIKDGGCNVLRSLCMFSTGDFAWVYSYPMTEWQGITFWSSLVSAEIVHIESYMAIDIHKILDGRRV